jgi:DNA-directed RNA polymerase subunit RPC12/RpoP
MSSKAINCSNCGSSNLILEKINEYVCEHCQSTTIITSSFVKEQHENLIPQIPTTSLKLVVGIILGMIVIGFAAAILMLMTP